MQAWVVFTEFLHIEQFIILLEHTISPIIYTLKKINGKSGLIHMLSSLL